MTSFSIEPQGAFSLRESAEFGFGQRHAQVFTGVMRMAFVLDGYSGQAGVAVRQDSSGVHVQVTVASGPTVDLAAVERQVARVLSLDVDARPFDDLASGDPVLGRVQRAAAGLRPPLFHSPYEAAAWSVLSARRPAAQMAMVREQLSQSHGCTLTVDGVDVAAFPTPEQLLTVTAFPGLTADKIDRLHGVARAAMDGLLDVERLRRADPTAAMQQVQQVKGIGPFYASLVVIRGAGTTDVLPKDEPRLLRLVQDLYGLDHPCTQADLEAIAQAWRPFRTWASVMVRAAAGRVLSPGPVLGGTQADVDLVGSARRR